MRWTAPEDAVILSVAPNMSVGSVVQTGTTVISLMPVRNPLDALVQVEPPIIGFVRPGDPVTLKLDAFRFFEHGTLDGTVKWVGDNASTRSATTNPSRRTSTSSDHRPQPARQRAGDYPACCPA